MQSYIEVTEEHTMKESLPLLLNNIKTAISQNSGGAFPTTNLQIGMPVYRTDQKKLYVLSNDITPTWNLVFDVNTGRSPDSEKLQGLSSAQFVRSDANDVKTGYLWLQDELFIGQNVANNARLRVVGDGGRIYFQSYDKDNTAVSKEFVFSGYGGSDIGLFRVKFDGSYCDIWHSGNDGDGSGMDADLLDGQQGAFYQNASNLNAGIIPDARISGSYTGFVNLTGSGTVDFSKFLGNAADSVTAPSFSWTGDSNTGIYQPAADQLAITTGGVQRALFNSSGISGVGTGLTALNASNLTLGTVAVARLPAATTSAAGISQLNDTVTSTSTSQAATANAVKVVNDNANGRLSLTGGTLTGALLLRPAGNAIIEHGRVDGTASTPLIDFHSSGNNIDYDSRIIASGGNASSGNGALQYIANGGHTFTGNVEVNTLKATGYMTIGANATPSSSANLKIDDSFTPNATRYGVYNLVNVTDGTLTAARTHYASYNDIRNDYISNDAYALTQYGNYSRVLNGPTGGAEAFLNTGIGTAGIAQNQAGGVGDLGRVNSATGVYGAVTNSNVGIITNAYAFRGNINSSNASGNIATAYGLHLSYSNTANFSGDRWGIYVSGETKSYLSGSLGIGVTSPTEKLDVNGNVKATNFIGSGANLTNINAGNLTTGVVPIARLPQSSTSAAGVVQLVDSVSSSSTSLAATANSVKEANDNADSRVSKSGDVMIGTLTINNGSPTVALRDTDHLPAFLHCNSNNFYVLRGGTANATTWDSGPNGRHPMILNLSSGDMTVSGSLIAYSDMRLKKDVNLIDEPLTKVLKLSGFTYAPKCGGSRRLGVSAQDVKEVIPEAVTEDSDGYLAVAYGNMVALLIEAIKELKKEVDSLKSK